MSQLISVIIPAFNSRRFISTAIESIRAQSYPNIEIIVVDDGSNDDTAEIAAAFADVRLLRRPHRGVSAARNAGVQAARGELIAFHDSDDISLDERLSVQAELLMSFPAIEYTATRLQNFVEPGTDVPQHMRRDELLRPRLGFVSTALMRRNVFERAGLFSERLIIGEDIDWLARANRCGIIQACIRDVLVARRLHDKNISSDIQRAHRDLFQLLRDHSHAVLCAAE